MTVWVPIPGLSGYEASEGGGVRSVDRTVYNGHGTRTARGRELKQYAGERYLTVAVSLFGRAHTVRVHVLIGAAFLGPRPAGLGTRHLNGDRRDNRAVNLAWGTQAENMADRVRHGQSPDANKTACKWGHAFNGRNLMQLKRGGRGCRACHNALTHHSRHPQENLRQTADRYYAQMKGTPN